MTTTCGAASTGIVAGACPFSSSSIRIVAPRGPSTTMLPTASSSR